MSELTELRNQLIYARRLMGHTLTGIGRDFGLSRSRVATICQSEERRLLHKLPPLFRDPVLAEEVRLLNEALNPTNVT